MNAGELLERIEADGVTVTLQGENHIKVKGDAETVTRWTPALKEHKAAIIEALIERRDSHREWLVYFDQSVKHLIYHPPVTQADVESQYPGAVRAEEVIRQPDRPATEAERSELRNLIEKALADAPEEIEEAINTGVADIDAALACYRTLVM